MARIEKTVFISYRRKDISWALAVYQYLTSQNYDVFFDFSSLSSGDFEQIILSNIRARAHFLLILTPTALDRCNEPGDWLRREIETAIDEQRNIIPLFFDGFNFSSPDVIQELTGKLSTIKRYNGLEIPSGYFLEAMERLRKRYLNVPLDSVIHPVSSAVRRVVKKEQIAADRELRQRVDIWELIRPSKNETAGDVNRAEDRAETSGSKPKQLKNILSRVEPMKLSLSDSQSRHREIIQRIAIFGGIGFSLVLCFYFGSNYVVQNFFAAGTQTAIAFQPQVTSALPSTPPTLQSTTNDTPTLAATTAPMNIATATVTSEPTAVVGIVAASEGGGAFIREQPGGPVLTTLANGETVTIIPNDTQSINGVIWLHVFVVKNDVRIDGWMMQKVLATTTPVSDVLDVGSTTISPKDGMTLFYVPAGEFIMGSEEGRNTEKPTHIVYLDPYWIDQTEITNTMYSYCVQEGSCEPPLNLTYYQDSQYADHPVISVSWEDADAYCFWAERRLPTEAEWEKAASWNASKVEKYVYPWGDDFSCENGNFDDETQLNPQVMPGGEGCDSYATTAPVGSFPGGSSPYGAFDMAGNVWEWVDEWYDAYPGNMTSNADFGTTYRVLRGGSWAYNDISDVRVTTRVKGVPTEHSAYAGFRCAVSAAS